MDTEAGDEIAKSGHGVRKLPVRWARSNVSAAVLVVLKRFAHVRLYQGAHCTPTSQTQSQPCGGIAMARNAESAKVVEVALAATLRHRPDVVCVPERAAAGDRLHTVEREAGGAGCSAAALERGINGYRVRLADGAHPVISGKDLVAQVAGVGAQTPLVNAVVGAEGAPSFRKNLELAPAAERPAMIAKRQNVRPDATAGESTGNHAGFRIDGFDRKAWQRHDLSVVSLESPVALTNGLVADETDG